MLALRLHSYLTTILSHQILPDKAETNNVVLSSETLQPPEADSANLAAYFIEWSSLEQRCGCVGKWPQLCSLTLYTEIAVVPQHWFTARQCMLPVAQDYWHIWDTEEPL